MPPPKLMEDQLHEVLAHDLQVMIAAYHVPAHCLEQNGASNADRLPKLSTRISR